MPRQRSTIYLAYGSNLNLEQMTMRCPTAVPIATAQLQGYDLKFRGDDGHAVATVEHGDGSVPVLLWHIQPNDEAKLDLYEGWPHLYRKETLEVEVGDRPIKAMVYIMNDCYDLGAPSQRYLDLIREGYQSAGFDESVLAQAVEINVPEHQQKFSELVGQSEMEW